MVCLFSYAILASASVSALVLDTPIRRVMSVHEDRTLPVSSAASGKPAQDTILNFRVALTAVNMSGLEAVLYGEFQSLPVFQSELD